MKLSPSTLHAIYIEACALDVKAFKPGNVSERHPGHGMQAGDFLASAEASANAMTDADIGLGERIYQSIIATHAAVGINTNLGVVLLCAPLIQAVLDAESSHLRAAVRRVLDATTLTDADYVFRAICIASPGGLGRRKTADVREPAQHNLRDSMALAADSDLIAAQYATGFNALFDVAVPHLVQALGRWGDACNAVTDLYLHLLTQFEDSHIVRKQGISVAREVRALARSTHLEFLRANNEAVALKRLDDVDALLKTKGINPGTTADFCVASLLVHRLLEQPAYSAGKYRSHLRMPTPSKADVPHLPNSQ